MSGAGGGGIPSLEDLANLENLPLSNLTMITDLLGKLTDLLGGGSLEGLPLSNLTQFTQIFGTVQGLLGKSKYISHL